MKQKNPLSKLRVLLVEDDPQSRAILRDVFERIGIGEIVEADDGEAAWNFIGNDLDFIDMIMCDWNMPFMSGMEFLKAVREKDRDLPFLMITGRNDYNSVVEAKKEGAQAYIRKPYTVEQIEAKMRALAHRAQNG